MVQGADSETAGRVLKEGGCFRERGERERERSVSLSWGREGERSGNSLKQELIK